jgi:hypothetical protein
MISRGVSRISGGALLESPLLYQENRWRSSQFAAGAMKLRVNISDMHIHTHRNFQGTVSWH